MRRRGLLAAAVALATIGTSVGLGTAVGGQPAAVAAGPGSSITEGPTKQLRLWYDEPAPDSDDGWVDRSLPLGNGYMGVNLFGGVQKDRIQITENSLQDSHDEIGGLNNFAEVFLDFPHDQPTDYSRDLVLNDGVAHVQYDNAGVTYSREYFTSYPDKVLAIRLRASEPGALDFTLRPTIPYLADHRDKPGDHRGKHGTVTADGDTVTLSGAMEYYNVQFEGQFKVIPEGGTMQAENDAGGDHGRIAVSDADSAVILAAVGTNYELSSQVFTADDRLDKLAGFPHPHAKVTRYLDDAAARSYDELLARHEADYTELYDRVAFDLGDEVPSVPTDELVDAARRGERVPYLEELAFQFGRYLLICSSRAGTLPPNLQGIWNVYQDPPWRSGYWHNVNLQMNYWPAFPTNLPELFDSYVGFYQAYRKRQEEYATSYIEKYHPARLDPDGDNGWSMGNSMWPYSGAGKSSHSGFGTGAWTAMLFWDYYDYTRDKSMLADVVYPALRGQANFLSRFVTEHDGLLLADPSSSPENADSLQTVGTTFDQQMIYENHRNTLAAAKVLGRSDQLLDELQAQMPKLDPIPIGKSGQIKEYREEEYYGDVGDPKHRHISQLLGLYPGQLVNSTTPAWLDAAKVSLRGRGDVGGTGWSQAQRIATWARAQDGDHAYSFYEYWLRHHAMHNLWNNHRDSLSTRLFQVDGNFGVTAGVSEMLLQSHEEVVAPLPALPTAWSEGSYRGLLARGNFEVSARWSQGHADRLEVLSKAGNPLTLRYPGVRDAVVRTADGEPVDVTVEGPDQIRLDTTKGQTYVVSDIPVVRTVTAPEDLTVEVDARDAVKLAWTASPDAASYDVYRAVGSAPRYDRVASGIDTTHFVDTSGDLDELEQVTYRVAAVSDSGRESTGATTVRLRPESAPRRVLRIDDDLLGYGTGDGEENGLDVADGDYTAGITWRDGNLTEIRLRANTDGRATLRNEMFSRPVRVYEPDGGVAGHEVSGDRLTLRVSAGETYRVVAQTGLEATVPDGKRLPGSSFPMSFTLRAVDHQTIPASRVHVEVPAGWTATPAELRLGPIEPGGSRAGSFTVTVPRDAADGHYTASVAVTTDEWSISAPADVEVLLPDIAVGKPATQSSLRSGGVPERAVDGNTDGTWSNKSVTHTEFQHQAWWQVDLGGSERIGSIAIWNRTDCCAERLSDFQVLVSDEPFGDATLDELLARPGVWSRHETQQPDPVTRFDVGRTGRYVRVQLTGDDTPLSLAEVQVFPAVE